MEISEGILFSDFQIRLQSISEDIDPNNSAIIITTTGIKITYNVYFSVMCTGNHTIKLALEQLLQEVRLCRLSFWYSLSSMPLPQSLAKMYFVGKCFAFFYRRMGCCHFCLSVFSFSSSVAKPWTFLGMYSSILM